MPTLPRRLLLTAALAALSGAALAQPGFVPVPPLRYEVVPAAPPGAFIWRPGHWLWEGRAYVWQPGRYVERRAEYREWEHGRWELRHGAYVWVEPHWR